MKSVKPLFILAATLLLVACGEQNVPSNPLITGGDSGGGYEPAVAPESKFTYQLQQPLAVKFTDNSSGNPTKIEWDFGDGATSSQSNPTHRYATSGDYIVTQTVSNSAGKSSSRKQISIPVPTVYISGVKYIRVGRENMYYKAVCKDDDFFTTTWFTTGYTPLLSNSKLPYDYIFASPKLMNGLSNDNYYTIYVYWNTKTNGNGTQILKQKMYTSSIMKYPEQIILTSDNADTQVAVMFSYK